MKRVLIVTGKVQRVGYRGTVQDIAQEMGAGGTVRNLPDGTVQVVCTGTREALDSFETRIAIRGALIQVSEVARQSESPARSNARIFKVIPDGAALEALEAGATGAKYLALMSEVLSSTADGVRQVGVGVQDVKVGVQELNRGLQDVKAGIQELNGGVRDMNRGMQERFDTLETRYGEIGTTATAIAASLMQIHEEQIRQRGDQEQHRAQMAQLIENNNRAINELTVAVRELRSNGSGAR